VKLTSGEKSVYWILKCFVNVQSSEMMDVSRAHVLLFLVTFCCTLNLVTSSWW